MVFPPADKPLLIPSISPWADEHCRAAGEVLWWNNYDFVIPHSIAGIDVSNFKCGDSKAQFHHERPRRVVAVLNAVSLSKISLDCHGERPQSRKLGWDKDSA